VGYRSANKTVYSAQYHIMWWPKHRRRVLVGRVDARLKQIIAEVVAEAGGQVIDIEVMPDEVALLVEVPPGLALSQLMQTMKGRSSQLVRAEFGPILYLPCLWRPSWLVSTVGGAPLAVVGRYAENHKRVA
jgi:putative transposase